MISGRNSECTLDLTNILELTLGFIVLAGLQYGTLRLAGKPFNPVPNPGFVPLLAICTVIATLTCRRPPKMKEMEPPF